MLACGAARRAAARLAHAAPPAAARLTSAAAGDAAAARDAGAGATAAPPPPLSERSQRGAAAPLYDTHVRLSGPQRAAVALGAAVGALFSPARADLVAAFGCAPLRSALLKQHASFSALTRCACGSETTGEGALRRMRARMAAHPDGADILARRPRITDATLAACWDMPPGAPT